MEFEDVLLPSVMLLAPLAANLLGLRQNQAAVYIIRQLDGKSESHWEFS